MKIEFLGTGAAEGVPAIFCSCGICNLIRTLDRSEYRTRSQVLIDGVISIDFPPEAYVHSLERGVNLSNLKHLFVTHSHMDHFYAHDFILHGYKYAELGESALNIYGNSEVYNVFNECTAREMREEVRQTIKFFNLKPYEIVETDGYKVIALPANHKTKEDSLLYYIERDGKGYLHLHDTYILDKKCFEFLAERGASCRAVAFDCTFADKASNENSRHMSIYDNMKMKEDMLSFGIIDGDTRLIITHFSHNANPTRARLKTLEEKYGVTAAYDGFTLKI